MSKNINDFFGFELDREFKPIYEKNSIRNFDYEEFIKSTLEGFKNLNEGDEQGVENLLIELWKNYFNKICAKSKIIKNVKHEKEYKRIDKKANFSEISLADIKECVRDLEYLEKEIKQDRKNNVKEWGIRIGVGIVFLFIGKYFI